MFRVRTAPDLERLREKLSYDRETGLFTWRVDVRNGSIPAGSVAGKPRSADGYRRLNLDGKSYACNQLAWYYVTGEWTSEAVTHINGDVSDDSFKNLQTSTMRKQKQAATLLTSDRVRELLDYNPTTGVLVWKVSKVKVRPGDKVGFRLSRGQKYWTVRIDGRTYMAHRVAWLHVHGRWPTKLLDHINGIHTDNRLCNLREADSSQNNFNRRISCRNVIGLKGVSASRNGKSGAITSYRASIQAHGKTVNLGRFSTAEEAHEAYKAAALKLHGEFARLA